MDTRVDCSVAFDFETNFKLIFVKVVLVNWIIILFLFFFLFQVRHLDAGQEKFVKN